MENFRANPLSIMFFGPSLSISCSSDSIHTAAVFQDVKSANTFHHKFLCYYSYFFGNTNTYMSLLNTYLARCLYLFKLKYTPRISPRFDRLER